ncbi:hypothetical protein SAMN05920897_11927 [Alkalispirochaeta americana]|uniref:Uncharacterized protein n=1 Tax=Alkalispirochaeta americana TaxID=159291 RepID=A0A1N6WXI1_9SPIO|nr:hypothetical protein SAMN05920897_11927 [Alkalispirochaeta americana]
MTIHIQKQPETLADRILRLFGKERAYIIPTGVEKAHGP